MTFELRVFKPNLVADADQFPQRLNVQRRLSQQHLKIASSQFVEVVGSSHQSLSNVLVHARALLRGNDNTKGRCMTVDYYDFYPNEELTPEQEAERAFDEWYGDWLSTLNDEAYEASIDAYSTDAVESGS